MATIRTAIELQDNFTSVLYQVINSVNLGLSAMEDLHQSMNAQVDTSSIEAARDSINQATIAVQELDAAMQGVEAPTIPTPTAPVSTAPVNIPAPQPTQWQSYDGLEVFKNTGVERFEQEVASVNSMLQDLSATQNRITQVAAESEVLSPQARYDVEAVENRVQALQQSIEQVEQNPLNIGSDSANASLEQLRARLSETLELQDNLNAAMQGADISQINAAYLQLSQNISETERMVRDSFENIPPVEIPVTWKTDTLEVFTSTGVDRFQQEVQSANNMLNTLNTTQERIASTAAQTNLFPASAVADMGRMGSRLQAIVWIIVLIIALIALFYAAVAAVNKFAGTSVSATGIICGVFAVAGAFIGNLFVTLINFVIDIFVVLWNFIAAFANFFANVFNDPVAAIARLFFDLVDTILSLLQSLASAIDTIFGSNLAGAVSGWRDSLGGWVDSTFGKGTEVMAKVNASDYHLDRFEYSGAWDAGYSFGEGIEDTISNFDPSSLFNTNIPSASDYTDLSNYTGSIGDGVGDIADNTGSIKDSLDITEEDLKYLRDIAEQEAINRFTTAEITIEQTNNNNVSGSMDLDGVVSGLTDAVNEAVDIITEGVHE